MANKIRVGVVGLGAILPAYIHGMRPYRNLDVVACADLMRDRAEGRAKEFSIPRVLEVDELIRDPEVDLVLNLTVPLAHTEICLKSIEAGKHCYGEKPFALNSEDARRTLAAARAKGVLLGSAPDTFLGGGIQTCRKLIDDGAIGQPIAATAFMMCHGHESWHPSPQFYYQRGGGPMFDMGPYYLTALVNLLGPAKRVAGSTAKAFDTRTITSQPLHGKVIPVETPTHLAGTVDFEQGAIASVVMSFDVWRHRLPCLEIHGTEGSLAVPDPNTFGGPVRIYRRGQQDWEDVALTHSDKVGRGIGIADMARSIQTGRAHRASGNLACHVVDIMSAFEESSESGRHIEVRTPCERPAALPAGLDVGEMD